MFLIYFIYFRLSPNKLTIITILLNNIPPESSLQDTFYHVAIITKADEGLAFMPVEMSREIKVDINIMGY